MPVLVVVIAAAVGLGMGIIISSLTTKYRDLNILISFGVGLLMYITPVVYPYVVPRTIKIHQPDPVEPASPLVEGFRYAVLGQGSFDPFFLAIALFFRS